MVVGVLMNSCYSPSYNILHCACDGKLCCAVFSTAHEEAINIPH